MTTHYHLDCKQSGHLCTVWYDRPLRTFAATVTDDRPEIDEDNVVCWIGGKPHDCIRIDDLATRLADYAALPDDVRAGLEHDRQVAPPPTHLQQEMMRILSGGRAR